MKRLVRIVSVLASALLLVACGSTPSTAKPAATSGKAGSATTSATTAAGSKQGQSSTLVVALLSTGESKIPAYTTTGEDTEIMNQIYGSLLRVDPTDFTIKPALATSYKVSKDGKTWTFKLRHGVKWQHGFGDFTCADVQFTWNFNKEKKYNSFWQPQAKIVSSVTCPDPYTAVIHLTAPFRGFIWNLVNLEPSTGWIMSKAAWQKLGKSGYEKTPVGTGPYILQKLVPHQDVILVRNPDYWGPKPAVAKIDFKEVADSNTAALGVKTGAIDIASVDPVTAVEYEHSAGLKLVTKQATQTHWLEINTTLPPFNNLKVREAMRDAIDYQGLVKSVLRGFGVPGYAGMIEKGMTGYDAAVNPQNTYDPAEAKKLLKESGVKLPIQGFFTTYNDTLSVNEAQFIAADFQAVGIDLTARPLERGTLVHVRIAKTTPASIIGSAFTPDPDFLLSLTFISSENPPAGLNIARYAGIDKLYQEQHTAVTKQARLNALKQIQANLTRDVPGIELYVQKDLWLVNNRVHGFEPQVLFGGDPLWLVSLSAK